MSTCSINCGGLADTFSRLLETTEHEEVLRLLDEESKTFALVSAMDADGKRAADIVEAFLLYMRGVSIRDLYWSPVSRKYSVPGCIARHTRRMVGVGRSHPPPDTQSPNLGRRTLM